MRGLAHTPLRVALLACALALAAGCAMPVGRLAERPWHEVVTPHFHLLSDASASETLRMAEELERFRQLLVMLDIMRWEGPTAPLAIFAVSDKYAYKWLTTRRQIVGWFFPTLRGSYAIAGTGVEIKGHTVGRFGFFHEYVHFVMSYNFGFRYPRWYEEGFADYLSTFEIDDEAGISVGIPPDYRIRQLGGFRRWVPFKALMEGDALSYPEAWIATHYLLSTPQRRSQLEKYLTLYDAGHDLGDAFRAAFDVGYGQLELEARRYYRNGEYPYLYFEPEVIGPTSTLESRLVAPSRLEFLLGDLVDNGMRRTFRSAHTTGLLEGDPLAAQLYEQSLEHDARNGLSLTGLAAVRLRTGDLEEAADLLRRAETLGLDAELLHTTRGNLLLARARRSEDEAGAQRTEQLEGARAAYRRAIELQPTVPEPYFGMAQTHRLETPASEAALEWLEAAFALSPREPQLMLELAEVKLARGDTRSVDALLERVLDIESNPTLRDRARALQRQLDRLERND